MVSLESIVRKIIKPILAERGFLHDNYLTFRKIEGNKTYIIEFQKGRGAATGQFAVNLSLYTPDTYAGCKENPPALENVRGFECKSEWQARLGNINENWFSLLASKLFGPRDRWWKDIFAPREKWWKTPSFEDEAVVLLRRIGNEIFQEGLPWLEQIKT